MSTSQQLIIALFTVFLVSCSSSVTKPKEQHSQLCTSEWYTLVEDKLLTADSQGHGPDIGSTEWRSVIEFKLGIRGDHKNPPLTSDQWCEYINKEYIVN